MERKNDRLPIFTERFRELQGERSNTEFADFLGISRQTVGFYCNGDRVPDALTLIKISQKCSVSADWLLGLCNAKTRDAELKKVCEYTGLSEQSVKSIRSYCCTLDVGDDIAFSPTFFLNKILESPDLYKSMTFTFEAVSAAMTKEHNIYSVVTQKRDKAQTDQEFLAEVNKFISETSDMLEPYGKVIINAKQAEEYCLMKAREHLTSIIVSAFEDMEDDIRERIEAKMQEL